MYSYLKNFLLIIICIYALQNNAQPPFGAQLDDKYTIIIGDKRITPPKNVHNFTAIKKELSKNYYDNTYHVIVQFNDEPNVDLQSQMTGKIFNELALTKNTYIAAVSSNINKRTLKKLNVRSILPLSPDMKITPSLLQLEEEVIKVNVVTPKYIDENMITEQLKKYDSTFRLKIMADSVNKYTYFINKSDLNSIAEFPWVLQINEGGMR